MKDFWLLLIHLGITAAKLLGPGGIKGIIAENLLLKQQLLVVCLPRQRAPYLLPADRFQFGFFSLFLRPGRIVKTAVGIRPSTLSSDSNAGIHALAIPASRESSRRPLALRLTETWFGVFSPSITTRNMAGMALLG